MTKEELENNYEYKVTKKALMKKFPFIKNVYVKDDEDINKWKYSIYLELVIDPYILGQTYGIPVWSVVTRLLRRGEDYWSPYLGTFFQDRKVTDTINRDMGTLMNGIHKSVALPDELKLPKELEVGTFITYPKYLPPIMNGNDEMTLPN
jgi:hypothetical protein